MTSWVLTGQACFKHCDDYIDDAKSPECLRAWLKWARSPAHGAFQPKPHPTLFADFNSSGERVRVTMASRMGDVGVTTDLNADHGYEERVAIADLSRFSVSP